MLLPSQVTYDKFHMFNDFYVIILYSILIFPGSTILASLNNNYVCIFVVVYILTIYLIL